MTEPQHDWEQKLHQAQTKRFIDYNPTLIEFIRTDKVADGAGGWLPATPSPLPVQRARLVTLRTPRPIITEDGREVKVQRVVVGMPDLDVMIGDQFTKGSEHFDVLGVVREPGWSVEAEVLIRGT